LQSTGDTLLLFNLSPGERRLISRLVSSFALETISLETEDLAEYKKRSICLVIFHVDAENNRQHLDVRRIREHLGNTVPILILVPGKNRKNIKKFLRAGADDYMLLPLNQNQFSVSFLILLEIGQAMAHSPGQESSHTGLSWNRLVNYFRAEESYFSPRSLVTNQKNCGIFDNYTPGYYYIIATAVMDSSPVQRSVKVSLLKNKKNPTYWRPMYWNDNYMPEYNDPNQDEDLFEDED